jgi:hypothetical protein
MKVFVLEIGRPIREDVSREIGSIDDYISITRAISELEIPQIASLAYRKIMRLARGGDEVAVVLSGPLALSFQLGQALGLSHAKITVYQFSSGRYVKVPPLTRQHLFSTVEGSDGGARV